MTLLEKLSSIHKPPICNLPNGETHSIEELWEKLIKMYLPKPNTVLAWHELLMNYIISPHPTFAIRGYNSFPPEKYNDLRRGFLTNAGKFSFFYTDNFFAAYIQKMSLDGYVPTFDEFVAAFNNREFPSRFGRNTSEERELLAVKQGKDPRINVAGFKLAHIIPVGQEYYFNGFTMGINKILHLYFPNGNRNDWLPKCDNKGKFYERDFIAPNDANKYAIAHFLRFAHPFNYFLCPQKKYENNDRCKELAEYSALIHYAHDYNLKTYGSKYFEFLSYIMPLEKYRSPLYKSSENEIYVEYGLNMNKSVNTAKTYNNKKNTTPQQHIRIEDLTSLSSSNNIEMAKEYLTNPNTSFRKLEKKFLSIDSAARGGGFISKSIINSMGITAAQKGILQYVSLDKLISESNGLLLQTLLIIKSIN